MPYINLRTNKDIPRDKELTIKSKLGQVITMIPGKTEKSLMINFEPASSMYLGGSDNIPIAYVQVKILGTSTQEVYTNLTQAIAGMLEEELEIPSSNCYVNFEEGNFWGVRQSARK